ncbi:VPDSG-CTERM-specific exosortase XrtC [Pedosphaera parvula]|uniref:Eight transmembrane protein EpsH n=1 Tax=Pedosphaera parvula (strain Ellin514) TaxID=320771 RepID=B9XD43_PEDPL|nr:VPDSG-CTERM-specific exosortase XrtC [Pedosphaera parvula]EEF62389.1 eight transmembrane protein EpsH [Pedosphaera parvula Ellin514]
MLIKEESKIPDEPRTVAKAASNHSAQNSGRGFLPAVIALVLCFGLPLYHLALFALKSELDSYILLIPFVSLYLYRLQKQKPVGHSEPARGLAILTAVGGLAVLAGYWFLERRGGVPAVEDQLALITLSGVLFFLGICCFCLGKEKVRAHAFPLCFLLFTVPLPLFLRTGIETFLQHSSALAADLLFMVSGTTFSREELIFQLPGIALRVAPECSGIHSSLILFITSFIASYLFLRSPWKRAVLIFAVIPLGIIRNGFRVFTIGELCVHIGPEMINSAIHHRGGPYFFALSLVPFFILLILLKRSERKTVPAAQES